MKGPQVAVMIWLGNLLLFFGGGALAYFVYTQIMDERAEVNQHSRELKTSIKRINWLEASESKGMTQLDFASDKLSLRERPKPKATVEDKPPPPPPPPMDDERLKAELQRWLNEKFELRMVFAGPPSLASATVLARDAKNTSLRVTTNYNFIKDLASNKDPAVAPLKNLDMTCVAIHPDYVRFKAPSQNASFRNKYFEVDLAFPPNSFKKPDLSRWAEKPTEAGSTPARVDSRPAPGVNPNAGTPAPAPQEDTRPKESSYDSATNTWTIGTDDYKTINENLEEFAKFVQPAMDANGKAIGIQIKEDMPDNSLVMSRGGQKGDIIKAINGKPVTSMAEVRAIVRSEYNAGKEEFVVDFERNGVPQRQTFRAPRK